MKIELAILKDFGSSLANGSDAAAYRVGRIDPYVDICEEITLNFTGIRNANSSFINALVSGLIEQHGKKVLDILTFKGCNPVIQVLVESAVDLGLLKVEVKVDA